MKYCRVILLAALTPFIFQQATMSAMKLRAPIRTWAGSQGCLCPYDQVVTAGINLMFPDEVYSCGETSSYVRNGGRYPACFVEDMNPQGYQQANAVEQKCRSVGMQICYVDTLNRF